MVKTDPDIRFIHLCNDEDVERRLKKLQKMLLLPSEKLKSKNLEINYILDFLSWWDLEYHDTVKRVPKLKKHEDKNISFVGGVLHTYIATDMRAFIVLLINELFHPANALLRRTIEYLLFSIWLDLMSKFGDFLEFFWDPNEWKPLLRGQRLNEKELNRKLKRTYKMNKESSETLPDFKRRYFRHGNEADFFIILSKIICKKCASDKKYLYINLIPVVDSEIDDGGRVTPKFNYDLSICDYCKKKKFLYGTVFHIPEIDTIHTILKKYFADKTLNDLNDLIKIYKTLSNHFVHFSTIASPTDKEVKFDLGNGEINLWGFNGTRYVLEKISIVLCNYFMILKNQFDVDEYPNMCEVRKKKFRTFH